MSDDQQSHPNKSVLTDFGLGRLEPSKSLWIEEHLAGCEECCGTLLNLQDDTFAGIVRTLPDREESNGLTTATEPTAGESIANELATEAPDPEPTEVDLTEPDATDGAADDESVHAATMLVQSGEPIEVSTLPVELQEHPRYEVVELIGQGGMGAVYRVQHRLMNRPVALKLINSQLIRHPQAVERFRREVQAAAQLAHPNIVAAYDAEQAGNVHFLAMEFVAGTDLSQVVQRRGPLPVAEACDYIRQAALGLQHAHEKGMVHRDIKPHNLMLSPDGQVRILDFGLAGFATEEAYLESEQTDQETNADTVPLHLTTIGSVMGTPDYIAPEQARDAHSADIRADIYSLGCTLYCLLAGDPPHQSNSVVEKLKAHAEREPESIDSVRLDVPQELADVIRRMMAKDPQERFQTPAEVGEALMPFACEPAEGQESFPAAVHTPADTRVKLINVMAALLLLAAVIVVATGRGRVEIQSEVDDVKIAVFKGGERIDIIDLQTGSQVKWFPVGDYELKLVGHSNDVTIDKERFEMTRLDKVIVTARWRDIGKQPGQPLPNQVKTGDFIFNPGFEESVDPQGRHPAGWMAERTTLATEPEADCYRDTNTRFRGTASGAIVKRQSNSSQPEAGFFQQISALPAGQNLRLSGYIKTKDLDGAAFLVLRIIDPQRGPVPLAFCMTPLVKGTTDWKQYEAYIRTPDATTAMLGVVLRGKGTVWFDELSLEVPAKPATENGSSQPVRGRR